jgi:ADP-ribosylglycohydrolase
MHQPTATSRELERYQSRAAGCLLGGALGDALGAPVEFDSLQEITERYGEAGLTGLVPYRGRLGLVTDDTQMTLFTAEGLIAAALSGAQWPERIGLHLYRSYRRWLATQELSRPPDTAQTWLERQAWLYDRRAPGNACLSGLADPAMGTLQAPANPGSKGCGTVMRSAPFGLQPGQEPEEVFRQAVAGAVLTHGHPTGYLAAGAFAVIVQALAGEANLADGVADALSVLRNWPGHEETTAALTAAREAAAAGRPGPAAVERLGQGWVAEEALAIGVYAALAYPGAEQARQALLLAVNHSGDTDSTGSVCGNLVGARHGLQVLPADWLTELEGRADIERLASDFALTTWPGWLPSANDQTLARLKAAYLPGTVQV